MLDTAVAAVVYRDDPQAVTVDERGEPLRARVSELIEGWKEGLRLMKPGAVYRLVIPAELGYGALGRPPVIPRDAELVFHVELLEVQDGER